MSAQVRMRFALALVLVCVAGPAWVLCSSHAVAQEAAANALDPAKPDPVAAKKNAAQGNDIGILVRLLIFEGGTIGWVIIALSVAFLALILETLLSVRRGTLMPRGLAEDLHKLIGEGQLRQAEERCRQQKSYLGYVVASGLAEAPMGYAAVEKAMEDASSQQAARLFRKMEYFTLIGTIAPMLGLLGTVQGMIEAFMEFENKANPQVSELAPGIYKALVTTFQGLCVAIPALAVYAVMRNRVDELVAQTTLMAEHVFVGYKHAVHQKKLEERKAKLKEPESRKPE